MTDAGRSVGPRVRSTTRGPRARILFIAVLVMSAMGLRAEPAPMPLSDPPGDLQFSGDLVPGFARDGAGAIVRVAYTAVWSGSAPTPELWVTDGTQAGTHPAAPGTIGDSGAVHASPTLGAFFIAHDDADGWQIHRTDGTAAGARTLTHVPGGIEQMLGVIGGRPIFSALLADHTRQFFAVDPDTGVLADLGHAPDPYPDMFATSRAVFATAPSGTSAGYAVTSFLAGVAQPITLPVPPPNTAWDYPHALGGGPALMCAKSYTHYAASQRAELYCSDGTVSGTRRPLSSGAGIRLFDNVEFYAMGDRVLFQGRANDEGPTRMWVTDGTDAGTLAVSDPLFTPYAPCTEGFDDAYFTTYGLGEDEQYGFFLAYTDGTAAGSRNIARLPDAAGPCGAMGASVPDSRITYLPLGATLYRSDRTSAGTYAIEGAPHLPPGWAGVHRRSMSVLGRWLVFVALDASSRQVLWHLDLDPVFTSGFDGSPTMLDSR